jgi:hypothetical protein
MAALIPALSRPYRPIRTFGATDFDHLLDTLECMPVRALQILEESHPVGGHANLAPCVRMLKACPSDN